MTDPRRKDPHPAPPSNALATALPRASDPLGLLGRGYAHVRELWPGFSILLVLPFLLWPLYRAFVHHERRWELWLIFFITPPLAFTNRWSKRLFNAILPFAYVGVVYELMKPIQNWGLNANTVHVCDLRGYELALFGITSGGTRMTLQDYFLTHHNIIADVYFAIPYGTYLFIPVSYAVFLFFRDYVGTLRYMWAFFALNLTGFITYHLYPAAPPWYFHEHGCAVDLTVHASEAAALMRVDHLIGIPWFQGLYGRSSDVFGAVPSLHIAYMYLIALESFRQHKWVGRSLAIILFVSTSVAAVYLDHHWVIDVLLGMVYTMAVYYPISYLFRNYVDDLKARNVAPAVVSAT